MKPRIGIDDRRQALIPKCVCPEWGVIPMVAPRVAGALDAR
jgi:hypothetical protein